MSTVKEFMSTNPISVASDCSIQEASRMMRQHDIGFLPVVDGESFRGVVTDRDIVVKALAEGRVDQNIGSIISSSIVSVTPDDDVKRATQLMSEGDVRRLPVTVDGRLVGIVSVGDLATRQDPQFAGRVMEQTGPDA